MQSFEYVQYNVVKQVLIWALRACAVEWHKCAYQSWHKQHMPIETEENNICLSRLIKTDLWEMTKIRWLCNQEEHKSKSVQTDCWGSWEGESEPWGSIKFCSSWFKRRRLCLARCWLAASWIQTLIWTLEIWVHYPPVLLLICFWVMNILYWVTIDLDWICINKSWVHGIVTCAHCYSLVPASPAGPVVTCRASGRIGGLELLFPQIQARWPKQGSRADLQERLYRKTLSHDSWCSWCF